MEYTEFKQLFEKALQINNLPLYEGDIIAKFHQFNEYLLEVNQTTNLTAIRNIPDVILKHDIDSLLASALIPQGARVLDLGCGPGFPSIPLCIARPDLTVSALDSTAKKIAFVNSAARLIKLNNLTAIADRAEDVDLAKQLGKFDIVISRAVARMNVLCELCLPYVKQNGSMLALKAAKAEEEASEAHNAIKLLGGNPPVLHNTQLTLFDNSAEPRVLIQITKSKATPQGYPRTYAAIVKKPL